MVYAFFITQTMKKIILMAYFICLSFSGAYAQSVVEDNAERTIVKSELTKRFSGIDVSYLHLDKELDADWGLGVDIVLDNFTLGLMYASGESIKDLRRNYHILGIDLGYNLRHWLGKSLYIEARAGVQYLHTTFDMFIERNTHSAVIGSGENVKDYSYTKSVWKNENSGDFGAFLTPRMGLMLGKSISLTAGYEFNFPKFKFGEDERDRKSVV